MADDRPMTVEDALRQASVSLLTGKLDLAEQFFRAALDADPGNAEARKGLDALAGRGKSAGGKPVPHAAAEPGQAEVQGLFSLFNAGRLAEAETRARLLIQRFPDALVLYDVLAATQGRLGKLEAAVATYCRAIELKPDFAEAFNNMGNALQDLGRPDEAVAAYRRAVEIKPRFAEAHANMGAPLRRLGRDDEAIASYRRAVKIKPALADAHRKLAAALRDADRFDEAEACGRQAVKAAPRSAEARFDLGISLYRLGRYGDALACFERALKLKPDLAEAHYNAGMALTALERTEEAVACYRQAVQIKPDYVDGWNNLGNLFVTLGRHGEALDCYRQALAFQPDAANAAHMVAALSGETTATAPEGYVVGLFDNYAAHFDRSLTQTLKYDIPNKIAALLRETCPDVATFGHVLDLGCGTGLSGLAVRPLADELTGVDLSPEMIRKAAEKNLYDALVQDDVVRYVETTATAYDLYLSTDVFIYLGALESLFAAIAARAASGALFCFSVEGIEGDGFRLRPSGRYAHSRSYIETLCWQFGFRKKASRQTDIRTENATPIMGEIYVLEKT